MTPVLITMKSPNSSTNSMSFRRRKHSPSSILSTVFALLLVPSNSQFSSDNNSTGGGADAKGGNNGFFVQIPHSNPPTVRPPPYTISHDKCAPLNVRENWVDTLCGDLNTGYVPQNPMGHRFFDGGTYPFETIKNKTLDYFRRALPILKSDKSLPKVAKFAQFGGGLEPLSKHLYRAKRGLATREPADPNPILFDASYPDSYYYDDPIYSMLSTRHRRQHRAGSGTGSSGTTSGTTGSSGSGTSARNGFCESGLMGYYNRLCKLYNAMWGKAPHNIHNRDSSSLEVRRHHGTTGGPSHYNQNHHHRSHTGSVSTYSTPNPKKHFRQAFHSRPDMAVGESDWTRPSKHHSHHHHHHNLQQQTSANNLNSDADLPPTPCPSAAEYLTPVFARNHEGAWRYVVQIPKEGYFTQTVEVTKCLKSDCYYMEGSCKTSPRWQSLLVAELFYPDATFPTTQKPAAAPLPTTTTPKPKTSSTKIPSLPFLDPDNYPDYLYSKGTSASVENLSGNAYSNELGMPFKRRSIRSVTDQQQQACDGYDDVGCYQVRLFYDWFLIPGSCKCWRRQFDFTLRANHG